MYSSSRARRRAGVAESGEVAAWQPEALGDVDEGVLSEVPADAPEAADADGPDDEGEAPEAEAVDLQAEIDAAYQRGYDDGRAEGRAVEATRVGNAVQAVEEVIARLEEESPQWQEALEKNLVALSTAIAREIVGRELKGSVEDLNGLVRTAVTEFPLESAIRIRLNPADLSAISSPLGGSAVEAGRQVRWIPDPEVSVGGCMVEGPETIVDGRVEKALDRIYTKLIYG